MTRSTLAAFTLLVSILAACTPKPAPVVAPAQTAEETSPRRFVPEGATAPLFNDLGDHTYAISTESEMAQRYFNQGLILTYAFNHAEANRSFKEAARLDPSCAMCYWGEAYGYGPNINKPMDDQDVAAAWAALQRAQDAAAGASEKERALIDALAERYAPEPVDDRSLLDRAYADAMREVARAYPDDPDILSLFAEALMDTMAWDYYQEDGSEKPETVEVVAALEQALERHPDHPMAIHLYIHTVEASATPGRAEAGADRLRDLVPGAGHLVHMPAHIYLRVGRYGDAALANEKAIVADESYITQCRVQGFYPAAYYPHNIHFLWAAASFEGRSEVALAAAEKLVANLAEEMLREVPLLEEFTPTYVMALARFGRWDEILDQPQPAAEWRYRTAIWYYARGLAFSAQGRLAEAAAELEEVHTLGEGLAGEEIEYLSGSTPGQLVHIASGVLEGRIAGAREDWPAAIASLEEAVRIQDELPYMEPPPWYFPVREALGDALLRAGRPAEAETVFREQLTETPRNGWSLYGLAESLRAQGNEAQAAEIEQELAAAWQAADIELTASVY